MTEYLEDSKFKDKPVYGGMKTQELVFLGDTQVRKKLDPPPASGPQLKDVVVDTFDMLFADWIAVFFFMIGLDFWEAKSKIILFIGLFLVPAMIAIWQLFKSLLCGSETKDKKTIEGVKPAVEMSGLD